MPAYNVSEYIEESIQSVLKQTYKDWELIVIDDCSTDDTVKVIERYLSDNRIKLVKNVINSGGAGSRNNGIKVAKGRYIAFLDSDDLWTPSKLEKQISFMSDNNVGFSFSGYSNIDEKGKILETLNVPSKVNFKQMLKHNYIGCLTAIYDTQPHGKIYMPLVKKRQDFALWLELLKSFHFAYGVQDCLGFYRIRHGSLSRSKFDAFKYYWRVLRGVGECGYILSLYNLTCYLIIVTLKKRYINIYHKFFIN